MYYQNYFKWKDEPLNDSKTVTIGSHGCLLTSLCNVNNKHRNEQMTPTELNSLLIKEGGYTNRNLIIWSVVTKILGCKIEPWFNGEIEYGINNYFIANFLNGGVGHFTNIINKRNEEIEIFDVWDNKIKSIFNPRRLIKITYWD